MTGSFGSKSAPTVPVYTSYFKDDYSEVELQPLVFEVLEGVFDIPD